MVVRGTQVMIKGLNAAHNDTVHLDPSSRLPIIVDPGLVPQTPPPKSIAQNKSNMQSLPSKVTGSIKLPDPKALPNPRKALDVMTDVDHNTTTPINHTRSDR